jgi:hypothetical protein
MNRFQSQGEYSLHAPTRRSHAHHNTRLAWVEQYILLQKKGKEQVCL